VPDGLQFGWSIEQDAWYDLKEEAAGADEHFLAAWLLPDAGCGLSQRIEGFQDHSGRPVAQHFFLSVVGTRLSFQCGSATRKPLLIFSVPLTAAVKSGEVGQRDTITSRKHNVHVTSF
jgi:hypothetical protein